VPQKSNEKVLKNITARAATPSRILITGASGGLGEAIARHYAAPGRTLLLWGRNTRRLEDVADACRRAGAEAITRSLDLTNSTAAIAAVEKEDDAAPIDLALFAAGLGDIRAPDMLVEDAALVMRLGLVNFVVPSAMASTLAGRMAARGRGRIALIGSAAAFHALPFAAAYAGSKAGLARFAQALRLGVAAHGVGITLVSPGFIDTAAGRKVLGPKPFLMSPSHVAARIAKAVARGQAHLVLPWPFALLRLLDRLLPAFLRDRLLVGLTPPSD
jgi:short-subunit dehydrogenase